MSRFLNPERPLDARAHTQQTANMRLHRTRMVCSILKGDSAHLSLGAVLMMTTAKSFYSVTSQRCTDCVASGWCKIKKLPPTPLSM